MGKRTNIERLEYIVIGFQFNCMIYSVSFGSNGGSFEVEVAHGGV